MTRIPIDSHRILMRRRPSLDLKPPFLVRLVERLHTDFMRVGAHFAQAKYVLAAGRVRGTGLFWV